MRIGHKEPELAGGVRVALSGQPLVSYQELEHMVTRRGRTRYHMWGGWLAKDAAKTGFKDGTTTQRWPLWPKVYVVFYFCE